MVNSDSQKIRSDSGLQGIGDYRLWQAPLGNYVIFKNKEVKGIEVRPNIIEGDITKWGKTETILYGYQKAFNFAGLSERGTKEGYFYLNTEDEKVVYELSLSELSELINIKEDELEKSLNEIQRLD